MTATIALLLDAYRLLNARKIFWITMILSLLVVGSFALVGANGGWMSKYATGIYSAEPADWSANDRFTVLPKAKDKVPLALGPVESAVVETYTINRGPKGAEAIFIGRSDVGERVVGNADLSDAATAEAFESGEPFGKRLSLSQDGRGRTLGRLA